MVGITSGGAAAQSVPPRLEGRGVHRREEAALSPQWPLAGVERVGEELRDGGDGEEEEEVGGGGAASVRQRK
jgi:hypothetical protein